MVEVKTKRKGIIFFISDEDADLLMNKRWGCRGGYIQCRKTGERLHRVILERKLGRSLETGEVPDHEDRNPMNCVRDNIRLATPAQNSVNRSMGRNNVTGYFGIQYVSKMNAWRSCVSRDGKRYEAGCYREKIDAAIAYNHLNLKLHGEFASFNDILGWREIFPETIQRPKQYKNTKGYCFHKDMQRYMAYIRYEGKTIHLGYHDTDAQARAAHVAKRGELYGANAYRSEVLE